MSNGRTLQVAALVLGCICALLLYRLAKDREQAEKLAGAIAASGEAAAVAPSSIVSSRPPRMPASPPVAAAEPSPQAPVAPTPPIDAGADPLGPIKSEALRTKLARTLARSVPGERRALQAVPAWLPLSEEQKDALVPLMVIQDLSFGDAANAALVEDPERRELLLEFAERQRKAVQLSEQLLGPDLYPLWKEYRETIGARHQLEELNRKLGASALPEHKTRALAMAMTRAEQQAEAEREAKYPERKSGLLTLEDVQIREDEMRRSETLMREAVLPHLSAAQLQAYDAEREVIISARERSLLRQKAYVIGREATAGKER